MRIPPRPLLVMEKDTKCERQLYHSQPCWEKDIRMPWHKKEYIQQPSLKQYFVGGDLWTMALAGKRRWLTPANGSPVGIWPFPPHLPPIFY
jgi:hypothetical protein